jgi:hypothetical protein
MGSQFFRKPPLRSKRLFSFAPAIRPNTGLESNHPTKHIVIPAKLA